MIIKLRRNKIERSNVERDIGWLISESDEGSKVKSEEEEKIRIESIGKRKRKVGEWERKVKKEIEKKIDNEM